MSSEFDIDPKVNAKAKITLLIFGIFSIIMIFAGLTSAYVVSKGSEFWVQITMPATFAYSTISILLSSGLLFLAQKQIKANKLKPAKLLIGLTLILGLVFGYLQYRGWNNLFSKGYTFTDHIINQNGRYGQYFTLSYQGKEITFDGYDLTYQGEPLNEDLHSKLKSFCEKLMDGAYFRNTTHEFELENYGTDFLLSYENNPVTYTDKHLFVRENSLAPEQFDRLYRFAESLVNGRGDFMMVGKYGTDFTIWYQGEELEYKNRDFFWKNKPLSAKQANELNGLKNKNSSYTLMFIFMHALHWFGGIIALLVIWIHSIKERYKADSYLGIRLGSIYWHFLGILWIYLYLFLIFIH